MFLLPASVVAAPAGAQLLSERVETDRRICTYYGTERSVNNEVVQRTVTLGLGQECPSVAPYRDPNAPPPPNAALLRAATDAGQRICIYGQGGIEYRLTIPLASYCPATPALRSQGR